MSAWQAASLVGETRPVFSRPACWRSVGAASRLRYRSCSGLPIITATTLRTYAACRLASSRLLACSASARASWIRSAPRFRPVRSAMSLYVGRTIQEPFRKCNDCITVSKTREKGRVLCCFRAVLFCVSRVRARLTCASVRATRHLASPKRTHARHEHSTCAARECASRVCVMRARVARATCNPCGRARAVHVSLRWHVWRYIVRAVVAVLCTVLRSCRACVRVGIARARACASMRATKKTETRANEHKPQHASLRARLDVRLRVRVCAHNACSHGTQSGTCGCMCLIPLRRRKIAQPRTSETRYTRARGRYMGGTTPPCT